MIAICHLPVSRPNATPDLYVRVNPTTKRHHWYTQFAGEVFAVEFQDSYGYWSRERDGVYNCINWIAREDAEVVPAP